jgi:hypothetical protein
MSSGCRTFHRRILGPIEVAAGICTDKHDPKYGLHSFRHAAASLFIAEGWDAERLCNIKRLFCNVTNISC